MNLANERRRVMAKECICPDGGAFGIFDQYCQVPGHAGKAHRAGYYAEPVITGPDPALPADTPLQIVTVAVAEAPKADLDQARAILTEIIDGRERVCGGMVETKAGGMSMTLLATMAQQHLDDVAAIPRIGNRTALLDVLTRMPDEAFSWFLRWAVGGWPASLGGFRTDSRASIEALRAAATTFMERGE